MITCRNLCHLSHYQSFTSKTKPDHFVYLQTNPCLLRYNHKCLVFSYSRDRDNHFINGTNHFGNRDRHRAQDYEEEEEEVERVEREKKVNCEVEVISWRERRVKGQILVNADIESVWNALTDYERLADFVPNLIFSGRIPCPYPGRIWLEQRGLQRALYWHIEARVVLDLQEFLNSANDRELHFSMVDGDFKKFEGKWSLKFGKSYAQNRTLLYQKKVSIGSSKENEDLHGYKQTEEKGWGSMGVQRGVYMVHTVGPIKRK